MIRGRFRARSAGSRVVDHAGAIQISGPVVDDECGVALERTLRHLARIFRRAGVTARLRAARPEPDFTLSMRLELDASTTPPDDARRTLDALAAAGVQHVMAAPAQSTPAGWLGAVDALAELVAPYR